MDDIDNKSYRQILKSTSIMGGSSAITIVLRIIRVKVLAVILGPSGVGLIGMYESITNLGNSIAGMGINSSGVRQIAKATSSEDDRKVAHTVICLRRTTLILGLLGLCTVLFLSAPISLITFGSTDHAFSISMLSVCVFFLIVSGSQVALIQGLRRLRYLAMLSMLGAFWGTVLSIPIIYFYGANGIVPYMITVSAMSVATSWWYSRKIKVSEIKMTWRDTVSEAGPLLRLGIVFMFSALMTAVTFYLLRVCVIRHLGLEAVGVYQAASALSSLYPGFILDAMGRDFYPRLTAVAQNNNECTSLINKQMEVGLLLAIPGIIATMTLAPLVINIFYSQKFLLAVTVLRWQILGVLLRVVIWPMSYLFIAKGNGKLFFWTELFANCTHLVLIWLAIKYFGLTGTGMAFFTMYLLYGLLIYWTAKKYYEFILSRNNIRILVIVASATGVVFISPYIFKYGMALTLNVVITIAIGLYAIRAILKLGGEGMMPSFVIRLKTILHT